MTDTKGSDCVTMDDVTNSEIKRVVAYYRVSTEEQGVSGLGLAAQRAEVESECKRRGWQIVGSHTDVISGRKMKNAPNRATALAILADRGADALVVTKVDRLSRSNLDFYLVAAQAKRQGWALVVLAGTIDMSTPYGRAQAGMMGVFAELESDLISERTRTAMAVSKVRGPKPAVIKDGEIIEPAKKKAGRPRQIDPAAAKQIVRRRRAGHSFQAIADELQDSKMPTPTGKGAWSWRTVERVARRTIKNEPIKRRARSGRKVAS